MSKFLGERGGRSREPNLTDGRVAWLVTAPGRTVLSSGLCTRPMALPAESETRGDMEHEAFTTVLFTKLFHIINGHSGQQQTLAAYWSEIREECVPVMLVSVAEGDYSRRSGQGAVMHQYTREGERQAGREGGREGGVRQTVPHPHTPPPPPPPPPPPASGRRAIPVFPSSQHRDLLSAVPPPVGLPTTYMSPHGSISPRKWQADSRLRHKDELLLEEEEEEEVPAAGSQNLRPHMNPRPVSSCTCPGDARRAGYLDGGLSRGNAAPSRVLLRGSSRGGVKLPSTTPGGGGGEREKSTADFKGQRLDAVKSRSLRRCRAQSGKLVSRQRQGLGDAPTRRPRVTSAPLLCSLSVKSVQVLTWIKNWTADILSSKLPSLSACL
ncbi:unnamed protein product [Pleuronectes platessa]|uniref:Uncharacterized protein n=1 Tax=Pleuronectes platessa TaxID=8262 RepID=A0A9N7U3L9_PLEPL|nr:unnamed protein product [Pleuronectes platessa]